MSDKNPYGSDRILTIHDERQRIVELSDFNLSLPSVDIFDEPTRCYIVNKEWAKIITGAISLLLEIAVWKDADDESYIGILKIQEYLIGDNCDMPLDCEDIDDCLETSEIIEAMDDNTAQNSSDLSNLSNEVDDLESNPQDGNLYNPNVPESQTDIACQVANYIIDKLADFVTEIDTYGFEPDILTALFAALNGEYFYSIDILTNILTNFIIGGAPALAPDFASQTDEMIKYLYCDGDFNKANFATWAAANLTRGQEIADEISCLALSVWQQWQTLGEYATGYDCSSIVCGAWCHRFEFTLGLDGWTLNGGTQEALGIKTAFIAAGGGTYSDANITLDLTGLNVTNARIVGNWVSGYLDNTSITWWISPLVSGTGEIRLTQGIGTTLDGQTRDDNIDVSDWSDIRVHMRAAANVAGQYTATPDAYIQFVELSGTGVNPFGSENCS